MNDHDYTIDAGTLVAIITFTVIIVSGMFALLSGATLPNATENQSQEQTINDLRVQRI